MIKAVLFDLDGTLLDTAPGLIATLNHLRTGLGLAALPVDDLRHFVSRGAAGLIKAGMPPCDDETLALWREAFLSYYRENGYVHCQPFDGVELMLSELKDRGIPWGIVTNKPEVLGIPLLKKVGWISTASVLIYGDTVSNCKPHPEPVLAACGKIGVEPENALMVGDGLRDVEAGQRAGCHTVFALYGYIDKESQLAISDGTALINTPRDVLAILEQGQPGG